SGDAPPVRRTPDAEGFSKVAALEERIRRAREGSAQPSVSEASDTSSTIQRSSTDPQSVDTSSMPLVTPLRPRRKGRKSKQESSAQAAPPSVQRSADADSYSKVDELERRIQQARQRQLD